MRLWKRLLLSEYLVFSLTVLYFFAVLPFTGRAFVSKANLLDIVSNSIPLLVVAIGQTIVLLTAGIDLSVIAVIGLASVFGATVMTHEPLAGHPAAAVAAGVSVMLLTGLCVGLANGAAITLLRMPPFMVTLTTMMFVSGCAVWFTAQSSSVSGLPDGFRIIGQGARYRIGPYIVTMPFPLIAAGIVALAVHVILSRTVTGRRLYAIGHNPKTALVSGVPVRRVIIFAYAACGICAAAASILYTARIESGQARLLKDYILLDIVGAAVIGGTSLFGGKGKVAGTVFGVLLITLINNSLQQMNLSHFTIMMVKGSVILSAALIDTVRNRLLAGR
jgi:ribose/xylose/arabinose/galactoside ABC-type transport system permease subunit